MCVCVRVKPAGVIAVAKKVVVCVKLSPQWIILVLHLNVLPIMPNSTSADKRAICKFSFLKFALINSHVGVPSRCYSYREHSHPFSKVGRWGVGVGGGGGSTLPVFSHLLKCYFILYLSFANDITRDLCIQNLLMFC